MRFFSLLFKSLLGFQVLLYKGSHTDPKIYQPLVEKINTLSGVNVTIADYSFLKRNKFTEDTIIVGHSFGGYFSLLDYQVNPQSVKGIVLLNSHFNSAKKAIYPGVNQREVQIPVLTILGGRDKRLPIGYGFADFVEKNEAMIPDKFYYIEPSREHFTGLTKESNAETEKLAQLVADFVTDIDAEKKNMSRTLQNCAETEKRYSYDFFKILQGSVNFNWSQNLYDGLAKIVMIHWLWSYSHYLWFLMSKPTDCYCTQFHDEDAIYFKTKNISEEEMITRFENQLLSSPDTDTHSYKKDIFTLPTVGISIPIWLSMKPYVKKNRYQIIRVPINNNTVYYKFPNPYRIILKKLET